MMTILSLEYKFATSYMIDINVVNLVLDIQLQMSRCQYSISPGLQPFVFVFLFPLLYFNLQKIFIMFQALGSCSANNWSNGPPLGWHELCQME